MRALLKKEFGGVFRHLWGYVCVSILLLLSSVTFIYYNLSYATENILSLLSSLSLVAALVFPVLAVNVFPNRAKENTDDCYEYLPFSARHIVLGKYFALLLTVLLSNIILVLFTVISGMYTPADHAVSYSALFGFLLFEAALLAVYMFIARCAKNRVIAYIVCYAVAVLWYFVPMLSFLIPLKPIASFIALSVLLPIAVAVIYLIAKKILLALIIFLVGEIVLTGAYLLFKTQFAALFERVMRALSIFEHYNSFIYGIFDVYSIIFFVMCTALFLFLTWRVCESEYTETETVHSLKSLRAISLLTAVLLCAVSLTSVLSLALLPKRFLSFDATAANKNSVSQQAKTFLEGIDKDVNIYILEPTGEKAYELYLEKLISINDKLHIERIYNEVTPEFYTARAERGISTDAMSANSLVIECGERTYYVSYYNLFYYTNSSLGLSKMSSTQYQYYISMFSSNEQYADYLSALLYDTSVYFCADEVICSYIEYAVADIIPANYSLTGHGEKSVEDENSPYYGLGIQPLDIRESEIPADAASIFVNTPTSDITATEREKLSAYLASGGQLTFVTVEANLDMPNLCALLSEYGLSAEKGIVKQNTETDGETQTSTELLPTVNTDSYVLEYFADDTTYAPVVKDANAIKLDDSAKPYLTLTPLLSSPSDCYITDSEATATYTLACSVETPTGARLVWFTGGESFNGGSEDSAMAAMCALSWVSLTFDSRAENLPATLYSSPLTPISSIGARLLSLLLIAIPIAVCAVGTVRLYKRKTA